jgi:hypothetical protein
MFSKETPPATYLGPEIPQDVFPDVMRWESPGRKRGIATQVGGRQALICPELILNFQRVEGEGHEFGTGC